MAGKPIIDWNVVRAAWEQNFVSVRSFCEQVGIDRTFLIEKVRKGGWKLLPKPKIAVMSDHREHPYCVRHSGCRDVGGGRLLYRNGPATRVRRCQYAGSQSYDRLS